MATFLRKANNKLQRMLGIDLKWRTSPLAGAWEALVCAKQFDGSATEEERFLTLCQARFADSHSQLFQDIMVLFELDMKREGFFVEFGATDGSTLSNTYLLEHSYDWQGILAEPARAWHERLYRNRRCVIDPRCITATTGEIVTFNETDQLELSTIDKWSSADVHASRRMNGKRYQVETVSLNDLLTANDAPDGFDYLSVDTEGSELEILQGFDFARYHPALITVEHNHTRNRRRLYDLLTGHGYTRKFERLSMFDDWYVRC